MAQCMITRRGGGAQKEYIFKDGVFSIQPTVNLGNIVNQRWNYSKSGANFGFIEALKFSNITDEYKIVYVKGKFYSSDLYGTNRFTTSVRSVDTTQTDINDFIIGLPTSSFASFIVGNTNPSSRTVTINISEIWLEEI